MKAVAVVAAVVALTSITAATAAPPPSVWLASGDPVTIRARGFHAHERVTVSVAAPTLFRKRTVVATRRGTVAVRFLGTSLVSTCGVTFVRATGATGTSAISKNVEPCGIDR